MVTKTNPKFKINDTVITDTDIIFQVKKIVFDKTQNTHFYYRNAKNDTWAWDEEHLKLLKKECEIKWWDEWLDANSLERLGKTKQLPVFKEIRSMAQNKDLSDEMFYHSFTIVLNSLFEDLENECYRRYKLKK